MRTLDEMPEEVFRANLLEYVMEKVPDLADRGRILMEFLDLLVPDGPGQIALLLLVLKKLEKEAPPDMPATRMRVALTDWFEARSKEAAKREART